MSSRKDKKSLVSDASGNGTSWYISSFIIVNTILGAGMLNFPSSLHASGGIVSSIACQIVIIIILVGTMIGFVRCAHLFNCCSYQEVIKRYCGKRAGYVCSALVLIYAFGIDVLILIVVGNLVQLFLQAACPHLVAEAPWYLDRKFLLSVVSVTTVLPLCYSKRIDFLKYPSSVGIVAIIYCVFLVIAKYFTGVDGALVGPTKTRPDEDFDVLLAIPTICFCYQGHLGIVPIFICTKDRESRLFDVAIALSLVLCFVIINSFGIFGYLTFGSAVQTNILLSYKATPEVICGVAAFIIKVIVTYPSMQFIGRNVVQDFIVKFDKNQDPEEIVRRERVRRFTIATAWFVLTLTISLFVPDIEKVIVHLGALAGIFIFIFPGLSMIEYLLIMKESTKWFRWNGLLITVACTAFGGFILGMVTTNNILKIIY